MRTLTTRDLENAQRLRRLWNTRHNPRQLTQQKAATALGITQSVVSQYINAHIALNDGIVIRFARLLGVEPRDIDPDLDDVALMVDIPVYALDTGERLPHTVQVTARHGRTGETA